MDVEWVWKMPRRGEIPTITFGALSPLPTRSDPCAGWRSWSPELHAEAAPLEPRGHRTDRRRGMLQSLAQSMPAPPAAVGRNRVTARRLSRVPRNADLHGHADARPLRSAARHPPPPLSRLPPLPPISIPLSRPSSPPRPPLPPVRPSPLRSPSPREPISGVLGACSGGFAGCSSGSVWLSCGAVFVLTVAKVSAGGGGATPPIWEGRAQPPEQGVLLPAAW